MNQASASYFSVLDGFASELGSTLQDLAIDWEEKDHHNQLANGKTRSKMESALSYENESSAEEFGKRLAKPLSFYNPVYTIMQKENGQAKVKKPTLIPLSQLNGNKTKHEVTKTKKEGKIKVKKKNGLKTPGILSKLSATVRRHSSGKTGLTPDLSVPDTHRNNHKRLSNGSVGTYSSEVSSTSNVSVAQEEPAPIVNKKVTFVKKVPPEKSPRLSKINTSVSSIEKIAVESKQTKPAVQLIQPSPEKLKSPLSSTANTENGKSESVFLSTSPSKIDNFGSIHSLSSFSEEEPPADVKTMEEVISEVAKEESKMDPEESSGTEAQEEPEFVEKPGRLKRNKTLRWTGTRKAPALMKEFSRRYRTMMPELYSSTEELESLTRTPKKKRISTPVDSRSCTPSQQTTSFGMGEDMDEEEDHTDEITHDDYISESEHLDNPAVFATAKPESNKLSKPEAKSPSHRDSAFIVLSSLLPPAPRLRRTQSSKVRAYLHKLGTSKNNALGYAVTQFVEETLKNKEKRPLVLLHDVRSFLSDIKQYFISNPNVGLAKKIDRIISKTASVDIDGTVDDALDRLILYPLHNTIYRCLVMHYKDTGQLSVMQQAISLAKRKTAQELGIRKTLIPPDHQAMEDIKSHFVQLQRTYSPYFKLKELLAAVTKIYQNTKDLTVEDQSARKLGADDFLPLLVYSLVHCDFVAADIETQYMDGLLDPTLLLGEGGYYLTTLISAIQVVISIQRKEAALPNISDLQGFLKVGISPSEANPYDKSESTDDDKNDEVVLHKTLHVPPAMTAQNLCDMISKKFNVATPENYCLHVVVNGVPHPLESNDCPQLVKMDLLSQFSSTSFYFSFQKRRTSVERECQNTMLVAVDTSGFRSSTPNGSPKNQTDFSPINGRHGERKMSIGPYLEIENSEVFNNNDSSNVTTDHQDEANKSITDDRNNEESAVVNTNANGFVPSQTTCDVGIDQNEEKVLRANSAVSIKTENSVRSRSRSFTVAKETTDLIPQDLSDTNDEGAVQNQQEENLSTNEDVHQSSVSSESDIDVTNKDSSDPDSSGLKSDHDLVLEKLETSNASATAIPEELESTNEISEAEQISLADESNKKSFCDENEQISLPHENNQKSSPNDNKPISLRDENKTPEITNKAAIAVAEELESANDISESEPTNLPDENDFAAPTKVLDYEKSSESKADDELSTSNLEHENQDLPPVFQENESSISSPSKSSTSTEESPQKPTEHREVDTELEAFNESSNPSEPINEPGNCQLRSRTSRRSNAIKRRTRNNSSLSNEGSISGSPSVNPNAPNDNVPQDITNTEDVPVECESRSRSSKRSYGIKRRPRNSSSVSNEGSLGSSPSPYRSSGASRDSSVSFHAQVELTPRTSRRSNAVKRRSRKNESISSEGSALDSPSLDVKFKRKSCMPRESVANLTEFFESKTNEQMEKPKKV